jgi:hypothetical protein
MAATGEDGAGFNSVDATYVPDFPASPAVPASRPQLPTPPANAPALSPPHQSAYQQPTYQQAGYQQPGYQQPGYQQPGYPAGWPEPVAPLVIGRPPAGVKTCRYCTSVPAIEVKFRRSAGIIFGWQTGTVSGAFCRDCGIATFRNFTAYTLVLGWWSVLAVFISPVVMFLNMLAVLNIRDLNPPVFTATGHRRLPMGRPVYERWQIVGVLVPVTVLALVLAAFVS